MKNKKQEFNKKAFLKALEDMGNEKGISTDAIVNIIKESFQVAITKKLEDEDRIFNKTKGNKGLNKIKLNDALVRCEVDLKLGTIDIYHQKRVVNDDDIQDDFIEIGLSEAQQIDPNLKLGDYYETPVDFNDFTISDVNRFKASFLQKISKAEKDALLETYNGRIGEIVSGVVEKADKHSVIVNLGRTTATLYSKDLIGNETFKAGDTIKVYIKGIGKDDKKGGNLINISRSCPEFLAKLFENEIHEIYDHTVIIKGIARIPGVRSKVSVYSNDPNVDASGACIGANGNRIQAIVSQLGNSKEGSREKIDVITYKPNLGLYLEECLKPGVMLGAKIDLQNKEAIVVTQDGTNQAAIGLRGSNVNLAKQLCGLNTLRIIDETTAREENLNYKTIEEFTIEARQEEKRKYREESLKQHQEALSKKSQVNTNEVSFVDKDDYEDELIDDEMINSTSEETAKEVETINKDEESLEDNVASKNTIKPVEEVKINNETPVVETKSIKKEPVYEQTEVKTTTTLESLEKSLEEEKEKQKEKEMNRNKKKKNHSKEDRNSDDNNKKEIQKMAVYTDEELADLDDDFEDDYDDEDDYSEYDSDSFYEDK